MLWYEGATYLIWIIVASIGAWYYWKKVAEFPGYLEKVRGDKKFPLSKETAAYKEVQALLSLNKATDVLKKMDNPEILPFYFAYAEYRSLEWIALGLTVLDITFISSFLMGGTLSSAIMLLIGIIISIGMLWYGARLRTLKHKVKQSSGSEDII